MKIKLIQIGKNSTSYLDMGIQTYIKRIEKYTHFEIITIPPIKQARNLSSEYIKEKEAISILHVLKKHPKAYIVLLDERGENINSETFASIIEKRQNHSTKELFFIIGGAYGVSPSIKKQAQLLLRFSTMTFSHQMIRLFFVEQLYRAFTIIKKEPYHNT